MTATPAIPDTSGAWDNRRLAAELGYPFSGGGVGGASWARIGRSQLIGAFGLKSSARVIDSVSLIRPPAPHSPFGITNGLVVTVINGKKDLFLSGFPKPPGSKDLFPGRRAGASIDAEA